MTATTNLFEYATRNKLRFSSSRGPMTVEQLWEIPLLSHNGDDFNLNAVAKAASKAWKELAEENFVGTEKTPEYTRRETALEVVKYVIAVKLAEEEAAKQRAANKIELEKITQVLAGKQADKLDALSEKELLRRAAELQKSIAAS